ncbi:MAG: HlyC/CorC family transporter [Candidatus Aminicenantes bacterium]|nr:HlyC/CorC family transporter [Candidatus Aminicenantes bacterium]
MIGSYLALLGWIICFLITLWLSLLHIVFSYYSPIGLARILSNEEKAYREEVIEKYDEARLVVDLGRNVFLLAFIVYMVVWFPSFRLQPLWFFLSLLAAFILLFDYLPRFLLALLKDRALKIFLPSYRIFKLLLTPLVALSLHFLTQEEKRQARWREHEASEEEIETFIDEATEEGIIEKDEDELLRGVVEFGDLLVREIMTPRTRIVAIEHQARVAELKRLFIQEKFSRIPVYRERLDNIEGMVMAKDLLEFSSPEHDDRSIDFLIRPVHFVPETMAIKDLLKEFKKLKQKLAMVVDEHGGISGLVTMEDVLEEIVGEIHDEYDVEEPEIVQEKPETYLVNGDTEIEELEELLQTELSDDNFQTISGLINQHLGRLPKKGDRLQLGNLTIEILEVDDKSVKKVRLSREKAVSSAETKKKE